jgi:hypothetical protein
MNSAGQYVYLCEFNDMSLYKIGYTNNPKRRLSEFRSAFGPNCKILYICDGGKAKEQELQYMFRLHLCSGEFFYKSQDIKEWFSVNGKPFNSPAAKLNKSKKMENDMELKPILVRLHEDVYEGLEVVKGRTRMSKAAICENALRDYFAKHGVQLQQPKVD